MNSIYLMFAPLHLKCKIGVSGKTSYRKRQVDKTVSGPVWVLIHRKVFGAYAFEKVLHFVFHLFRSPIRGASGGTEFFWGIVAPIAFLAILFYEVICLLVVGGLVWALMWLGAQ